MNIQFISLLGLLFQGALSAQQTVSCSFNAAASNGATCQSFATAWGISLTEFESLNPGARCPTLVGGQSYCVIGTVLSDTTTTTTSSKSPTPTTPTSTTLKTITTTTSSSSYSPTQPGLAANCDKFYLVSSGDTCVIIEAKFGISSAQFAAWNPYINAGCSNLWLDYYVCVHVPGATTTAPSTPTSTPTGPEPQMPGIVSNCKKFHLVQSGDSCYTIDVAAGISLAQFRSWNTNVDAACDNLWLGYYVCVGV